MTRSPLPDPNQRKSSVQNPLWLIINISIPIFIILMLLHIGVTLYGAVLPNGVSNTLQLQITAITATFWNFIKPFLQILIMLTIVQWILDRLGFSLSSRNQILDWNVQTVIAVIVTTAFAIAALSGITEGASLLKDLALVVVGFYFGTQRRDIYDSQGRLRLSEVHINDILEQQVRIEQARRLAEQRQERDEDIIASPSLSNRELGSPPQETDAPATSNEPQPPTDA